MEDVLELYEELYDPTKPVVCFDELPFQLVAEIRTPLPSKPGCPARYDYEYERRGMANVFAIFEPKGCRRHLEVTERRTGVDFALAMRKLVDEHYPEAEKIRVVLDNLNTHTGASLYRAFEPSEARRVLRKLEVELSVLSRQCLSGQRIPDQEMLAREVAAWESERNEQGATVDWRFTAADARQKLARLYPAQS